MGTRTDASKWLYERAELHGIELWGTSACVDHSSVPKGIYCYDLYSKNGLPNERNTFIAKKQTEGEAVGAVLCAAPLPFQDKDFLSIRGINRFEKESLWDLDEIVNPVLRLEEQQQESIQIQNL